VYPLLLQVAGLPSRAPAGAGFADRLASRLAVKVGFRIDHGVPEANPHGPTLLLTPEHAVRLDTHRMPESIGRRKQQWLSAAESDPAAKKALPLTERATIALLDDLERRWTDASPVAVADGPAAPDTAGGSAASSRARVRFGLQRLHSTDLQPRADTSGAEGAAGARCEYRRREQNTIIRRALGGECDRREPAVLVMAEGETVDRVDRRTGGRFVFERHGTAPRAALGALLAIAPQGSLSLATIEAIEQIPEADYLRLRGQRLTVRSWPGTPVPAGVKIGDALSFIDAW